MGWEELTPGPALVAAPAAGPHRSERPTSGRPEPAGALAVLPGKSRAGLARPLPAVPRRFLPGSAADPLRLGFSRGETMGGAEATGPAEPPANRGDWGHSVGPQSFPLYNGLGRDARRPGSPPLPPQWTAAFTGPPGPCSPTSAGPCRTARPARPRSPAATGCPPSVSAHPPPTGRVPALGIAAAPRTAGGLSGGTAAPKVPAPGPARAPRGAWRRGWDKDRKGGSSAQGRDLRAQPERAHGPAESIQVHSGSGRTCATSWPLEHERPFLSLRSPDWQGRTQGRGRPRRA